MAVFQLGLMLFLAMAAHSDATYCVCNSGVSETILQSNIDYACANGADCAAINQNGACYNPNSIRDHCSYAVNSYYQRKGQASGSCDFHGSATVTANAPTSAGSGCVYQASPSNGGTSTTPPTGGTSTTPPTGGTSTTPPTGGTPNTGTGGTPSTGTGGTPSTGTGGTPSTGTGGTPSTGTGGTPSTGTGGTPSTGTGGTPSTGTGGTPNTGMGVTPNPTMGGAPNASGTTNPGMGTGSTMAPPGLGLGPTGSGFGNTDSSASVKLVSPSSTIVLITTLLITGLMSQRI